MYFHDQVDYPPQLLNLSQSVQNVVLNYSCTSGWLWLIKLLYIISFCTTMSTVPLHFYGNLKKNHHYKPKCYSLKYKHCDAHTSTSLLHRMSTKASWFFPFHDFTHTMCLRVRSLSGFS